MTRFWIEKGTISEGELIGKSQWHIIETPQDEPYHNDEHMYYRFQPNADGTWFLEKKRWRLGQNRVQRTSVAQDYAPIFGDKKNGVSFERALEYMMEDCEKHKQGRPREHEVFEALRDDYLERKAAKKAK